VTDLQYFDAHYLKDGWRSEAYQLLAYGESNVHMIDYDTCTVFLFGTDYILSRHFQNRYC